MGEVSVTYSAVNFAVVPLTYAVVPAGLKDYDRVEIGSAAGGGFAAPAFDLKGEPIGGTIAPEDVPNVKVVKGYPYELKFKKGAFETKGKTLLIPGSAQ